MFNEDRSDTNVQRNAWKVYRSKASSCVVIVLSLSLLRWFTLPKVTALGEEDLVLELKNISSPPVQMFFFPG